MSRRRGAASRDRRGMVVGPLILDLRDLSIARSLDFLPDGAVGVGAPVVAAGILAALDLLLAVFAPVEVVVGGWFGGGERVGGPGPAEGRQERDIVWFVVREGGGGRVLLEGGSAARGRERTPVVGDCGACETRRDGKKMRNGETRGEIERGRICMSHEGIKVQGLQACKWKTGEGSYELKKEDGEVNEERDRS